MDAPPIQYARTEDGVNLAYWTLGERANPALIIVPWGIGHLTVEWEIEHFQPWYERLLRRFFLVAYDARGSGLSQRGVTDLALARYAGDIAAVAAHVELDRYTLLTHGLGAMPSIAHAVDRPEAVSHLVLWTPVLNGSEYGATLLHRAIGRAAEVDFTTWRRTVGSIWTEYADADLANELATMLEKGTTADHYLSYLDSVSGWDITAELPQVRAKTLIFGVNDLGYAPLSFAQKAASAIPHAQLIVAAESVGFPQLGDAEAYARDIEALVFGEVEALEDSLPGGLRTLLFTDLESSTALTQVVGDAKAQEVLDGHDSAVRAALQANGGEEVKHTGDGIFAAFGSAVSAVEAALQIQRELAGAEVRVRVGLNAGEPIAKDDDYFGAAVQLAARVCDRAQPGQVLVSNVVKELCSGKLFQFADQGEVTLKGFPEPVQLFVVGERAT